MSVLRQELCSVERREGGFTLLELLLAVALLIVVLATLATLFANSREAYGVNEEITDRQQTIQSAINVFRYEISLAGYRGTCAGAPTRSFAEPTFELARGDVSDSVTVRYFEDRWPANACGTLRETTLFVDDGQNVLYMRRDGGTPEPALANVHSFRVVNFMDQQGGRATEVPPAGFIGIDVRVDYEDPIGSFSQFVVGVKNPQQNLVGN